MHCQLPYLPSAFTAKNRHERGDRIGESKAFSVPLFPESGSPRIGRLGLVPPCTVFPPGSCAILSFTRKMSLFFDGRKFKLPNMALILYQMIPRKLSSPSNSRAKSASLAKRCSAALSTSLLYDFSYTETDYLGTLSKETISRNEYTFILQVHDKPHCDLVRMLGSL